MSLFMIILNVVCAIILVLYFINYVHKKNKAKKSNACSEAATEELSDNVSD